MLKTIANTLIVRTMKIIKYLMTLTGSESPKRKAIMFYKTEFKTIYTTTEAEIAEVERLLAEGWKLYHSGLFIVQLYRMEF